MNLLFRNTLLSLFFLFATADPTTLVVLKGHFIHCTIDLRFKKKEIRYNENDIKLRSRTKQSTSTEKVQQIKLRNSGYAAVTTQSSLLSPVKLLVVGVLILLLFTSCSTLLFSSFHLRFQPILYVLPLLQLLLSTCSLIDLITLRLSNVLSLIYSSKYGRTTFLTN